MRRLGYVVYVGAMGLSIVAAAFILVVGSASLGVHIVRLLLP